MYCLMAVPFFFFAAIVPRVAENAEHQGNRAGDLVAGRYRLSSVAGSGGMGRVWRARDERLDREVAVKEVLLPPGVRGEERERLNRRAVREGRSAARLSHPGIITMHDIVIHRDSPFLVMEYLPGRSLAEAFPDLVAAMVARHEAVSMNKNRQRWCYLDGDVLVKDDLQEMQVGFHAFRFPQLYSLCWDLGLRAEDLGHGV